MRSIVRQIFSKTAMTGKGGIRIRGDSWQSDAIVTKFQALFNTSHA